ncbi:MAG: YtxH domain-containing protein [Sandaracinaceae bacterium]
METIESNEPSLNEPSVDEPSLNERISPWVTRIARAAQSAVAPEIARAMGVRPRTTGSTIGIGLASFATGALVGAGFGLLLAPASGEETRARMSELIRGWMSSAQTKGRDAMKTAQTASRDAVRSANDKVSTWVGHDDIVEDSGKRNGGRTKNGKSERTTHA